MSLNKSDNANLKSEKNNQNDVREAHSNSNSPSRDDDNDVRHNQQPGSMEARDNEQREFDGNPEVQ